MKKKGSAIVFIVLLLSFLLAISLNIFFQARMKAKRAIVKVDGEQISNNIDIASSLGYQELKLAEIFLREGIPYSDAHPESIDSYTLSNGNKLYIDLYTGFFTNKYPGVNIDDFIDFFSSNWDHSNTLNQRLIVGEEISNLQVEKRTWQSTGIGNLSSPLWLLRFNNSTDTSKSLGGYSLVTNSTLTDTNISTPTRTGTATYEKYIQLDSSTVGGLELPESIFKITVTETFEYSKSGSNITILGRSISDFLVEAI